MDPHPRTQSPLALVEACFTELSRGPAALSVDGRDISAELPPRPVALDELRQLALEPATSYATRDRALGLVIRRAQSDADRWMVGAIGLLLPGLRRVLHRLPHAPAIDDRERESELLAAVVDAIRSWPAEEERIAARICWRVFHLAGRRIAAMGEGTATPAMLPDRGASPSIDIVVESVLTRAVRSGAVSASDAELIARTRLDGVRVTDLAAQLGVPAPRLQQRRLRAEARIAALVAAADDSAGSGPVAQGRCHGESPRGRGASAYHCRPGTRRDGAPGRSGPGPRPAASRDRETSTPRAAA